jgi:hypothetical protein
VLELTRQLRASGFVDTAEVLELAYDSERRVVALTVPDRKAILRTLEDGPTSSPSWVACCSGSTPGAWSPLIPNVRKRASAHPHGCEPSSGATQVAMRHLPAFVEFDGARIFVRYLRRLTA